MLDAAASRRASAVGTVGKVLIVWRELRQAPQPPHGPIQRPHRRGRLTRSAASPADRRAPRCRSRPRAAAASGARAPRRGAMPWLAPRSVAGSVDGSVHSAAVSGTSPTTTAPTAGSSATAATAATNASSPAIGVRSSGLWTSTSPSMRAAANTRRQPRCAVARAEGRQLQRPEVVGDRRRTRSRRWRPPRGRPPQRAPVSTRAQAHQVLEVVERVGHHGARAVREQVLRASASPASEAVWLADAGAPAAVRPAR